MSKIEIGCYVTSKSYPGLGPMFVQSINRVILGKDDYMCRMDGKLMPFEKSDLRIRPLGDDDRIRIMWMQPPPGKAHSPFLGLEGIVKRYNPEKGELSLYTENEKYDITGIVLNKHGNIDTETFLYYLL